MRAILFSILTVLATCGGAVAQVPADARRTWADPDLGGAILEGVGRADYFWLRGESKKVVRFDRRSGERVVVADQAIDLMADGEHIWALVGLDSHSAVIRNLRGGGGPQQRINFVGGAAISMFQTPDGPGVLTTTMALPPSGEGFARRRLAASLEPSARVSPLTGNHLFVGYNKGEWGGGLRRVDLSSGAISIVKEDSDELCGGRLNPECAPVVGIVPDTSSAGCLLVGASLAHLSGRYGEVMRVCDDRISSVFQEALPVVPNSLADLPGRTWPFTDLVQTRDGWVAVGQARFARAQGATIRMGDIPPLRPWSGLQISDPVEGVVFVQSACCWGSDTSVQYRVLAIPVDR